jgi:hypothetical protein
MVVIVVLGILASVVFIADGSTPGDAIHHAPGDAFNSPIGTGLGSVLETNKAAVSSCKTDQKSIELSVESVLARKPGALALTDVAKADLTNPAVVGLLKTFPASPNYTLDWVTGVVTVQASTPLRGTTCAAFGS